MNKMWYTYTMEYYSAFKRKDTRKFKGKWMKPEKKIILREITQAQKDKYGMYLFTHKWVLAVK